MVDNNNNNSNNSSVLVDISYKIKNSVFKFTKFPKPNICQIFGPMFSRLQAAIYNELTAFYSLA